MGTLEQESQASADWSRTAALGWTIRQLHNVAIQLYMASRTKERYNEIYEKLNGALADLTALHENGFGCPDGWCPDERDRCIPCEQNGPSGPPTEPLESV